jgi:beta-lactamase class A
MITLRFLLVLLLAGSASASDLQTRLEKMAAAHPGKVALFAKNLTTGETVAINADTPVKTASVIKLPIMVEAFAEVKEGKRSLDDKVTLRGEEKVFGSGVFHFLRDGLQLTVEETIWNMMIFSDNTATNLMINMLTTSAVNARLQKLGLKNTWLYKKIGRPATEPMPADQKQFGLGKTTAREMGRLLEWLARCELNDEKLCRQMIWIMRNQQDRTMLARYLEAQDTTEEETPSYVAAKLGALNQVRNDVGIVYTKAGPIVIAAFTYDNKDESWTPDNRALLLVAGFAREIVKAWSPTGMQTSGEVPLRKAK